MTQKSSLLNPSGITKPLEVDLKTNRNAKMIQALLSPTVNGLFLFYLDDRTESLLMPPGLNNEEIEEFKYEFLQMFERFARKANKKG